MKLSARNQFKGKIVEIERRGILTRIRIKIDEPIVLTVVIAKEAAKELGIKPGVSATVVFKATEALISTF